MQESADRRIRRCHVWQGKGTLGVLRAGIANDDTGVMFRVEGDKSDLETWA